MLALVFPGQGSQKVGMGKEIAAAYPAAKEVFEQADAALGYSISKLCFEGPEKELELTANSQPAILATSIATWRVLEKEGRVPWPDVAAGHSLGEYTALVCTKAMTFEDAVRTVHKRGQFMQEAVPAGQGSMAAIMGMEQSAVETLCRDAAQDQILCPANFNAPSQIVIAGHAQAVERAIALAKERSGMGKLLKVSAPFHCPLMELAATKLASVLKELTFADPKRPVVMNVTAEPNKDGSKISELLYRQVVSAVQWEASVKKMVEMGVTEFIEVGAGKVLTGLIKRIQNDVKVINIETPKDIEENKWIVQEDGTRYTRDKTLYEWPDGLKWDFYDPKCHGF